jgi:hypothetical protein
MRMKKVNCSRSLCGHLKFVKFEEPWEEIAIGQNGNAIGRHASKSGLFVFREVFCISREGLLSYV